MSTKNGDVNKISIDNTAMAIYNNGIGNKLNFTKARKEMEAMPEKKNYTPDQMEDAKKLAKALVSVPDEKRPFFALLVESMLIGAELAEKQLTAEIPRT